MKLRQAAFARLLYYTDDYWASKNWIQNENVLNLINL